MIESTSNILAIEVGSSRVKLGYFPAAGACASDTPAGNLPIAAPPLREPSEVFWIDHRRDERQWLGEVESHLRELSPASQTVCVVADVHRAVASTLQERLLAKHDWARVVTLSHDDISIKTDVKEQRRVGMDRLLNALAVNRVRRPDRSAIVVDIGTAMTVNFISTDGVFQGGAILAGPVTSLAALHHATASLPLLDSEVLESRPPVIGKCTEEAMTAGAFWGAVGAARGLIERIAETCDRPPDVFLTGGASRGVAPFIGMESRPARHLPHLVLSGIRLAAEQVLTP
jgi:type III pantothenate kinase